MSLNLNVLKAISENKEVIKENEKLVPAQPKGAIFNIFSKTTYSNEVIYLALKNIDDNQEIIIENKPFLDLTNRALKVLESSISESTNKDLVAKIIRQRSLFSNAEKDLNDPFFDLEKYLN